MCEKERERERDRMKRERGYKEQGISGELYKKVKYEKQYREIYKL